MKVTGLIMVFLAIGSIGCFASQGGSGTPAKFLSSCEIDLNGDSVPDIAMLLETVRGRELIVLLKAGDSYVAYTPARDLSSNTFLRCEFGDIVSDAASGDGNSSVTKTPGAYLVLYQPEGAAASYYWDGHSFEEVWTSD